MTESKKCNLSKEIASIENEFQSLNIEPLDSIRENFAILEKEINNFSHKDNLLKTNKTKNNQSKQLKISNQNGNEYDNNTKKLQINSKNSQISNYQKSIHKAKNAIPIPKPVVCNGSNAKLKINTNNIINPIKNNIFDKLYNESKVRKSYNNIENNNNYNNIIANSQRENKSLNRTNTQSRIQTQLPTQLRVKTSIKDLNDLQTTKQVSRCSSSSIIIMTLFILLFRKHWYKLRRETL